VAIVPCLALISEFRPSGPLLKGGWFSPKPMDENLHYAPLDTAWVRYRTQQVCLEETQVQALDPQERMAYLALARARASRWKARESRGVVLALARAALVLLVSEWRELERPIALGPAAVLGYLMGRLGSPLREQFEQDLEAAQQLNGRDGAARLAEVIGKEAWLRVPPWHWRRLLHFETPTIRRRVARLASYAR
jgi:hypothetical protein